MSLVTLLLSPCLCNTKPYRQQETGFLLSLTELKAQWSVWLSSLSCLMQRSTNCGVPWSLECSKKRVVVSHWLLELFSFLSSPWSDISSFHHWYVKSTSWHQLYTLNLIFICGFVVSLARMVHLMHLASGVTVLSVVMATGSMKTSDDFTTYKEVVPLAIAIALWNWFPYPLHVRQRGLCNQCRESSRPFDLAPNVLPAFLAADFQTMLRAEHVAVATLLWKMQDHQMAYTL